jgi:hypothetical protein
MGDTVYPLSPGFRKLLLQTNPNTQDYAELPAEVTEREMINFFRTP